MPYWKPHKADSARPVRRVRGAVGAREQDDPQIVPVMLSALRSPGLDRSPCSPAARASCRVGALDRAINGRSDMLVPDAVHCRREGMRRLSPVRSCSPSVSTQVRCARTLLKRLRASREPDREALVRTAAIAADAVAGCRWTIARDILWRLARGEAVDSLSSEIACRPRPGVQALVLDPGSGAFIAWIAEAAFKLPLNGEVGNIRAFIFPNASAS